MIMNNTQVWWYLLLLIISLSVLVGFLKICISMTCGTF